MIFSTEWDFLIRSITYYMPTEALSAMWAFYTVKMVEQLHHSSIKIMTDLAHPLKVLWLSLKSKPHSFVGCQTHSVTHFLSSFNFKFLYNQSIPAGWESHIEPLYTTEKKAPIFKTFYFSSVRKHMITNWFRTWCFMPAFGKNFIIDMQIFYCRL